MAGKWAISPNLDKQLELGGPDTGFLFDISARDGPNKGDVFSRLYRVISPCFILNRFCHFYHGGFLHGVVILNGR